jgi:hypothetical protein
MDNTSWGIAKRPNDFLDRRESRADNFHVLVFPGP